MDIGAAYIGFTLLLSALAKIMSRSTLEPYLVAIGVARHRSTAATHVIISIELAVGILVLQGAGESIVYPLACAVTSAFVLAHLVVLSKRTSVSCACFGAIDDDLSPAASLARSAVIATISIVLTAIAWMSGAWPSHIGPAAYLAGALSAMSYVVAVALLDGVGRLVRHQQHVRHLMAEVLARRTEHATAVVGSRS